MDWLLIEGLKPWDGRYELDLLERPPTMREWIWLSEFAKILPVDWVDAVRGHNQALTGVLALIALHRAGKLDPAEARDLWERLLDEFTTGQIRYELGDDTEAEAADAGPPAESSNGNGGSSGPASRTSSDASGDTPAATGTPASATSESATASSPR